jgi:cyclopropane fatty-acyl-phospholipid synthase-like methyltransferase
MRIAGIENGYKILDAGCGVGGAAFFLSQQKDVRVVGITLSERQLAYANSLAEVLDLKHRPLFYQMDYTNTSFDDESFDVVWACESFSSAPRKELFVKEAYRLLKKGGKLILSDYFLSGNNNKPADEQLIKKWSETWSISNLIGIDSFQHQLSSQGFNNIRLYNYTDQIKKSAKRMYIAGLLACIPSELYNFFHRNVSRFARHHYKSGYYQYKALKKGLWQYRVVCCLKPL